MTAPTGTPPTLDPPPHTAVAGDGLPGAGPASSRLRRRAYYFFLVRGGVALGLGVAILGAGTGMPRLATFVAVYWIVAALVTLRWLGAHRGVRGRRLGFLAGATGLAAGVALAAREPLAELMGVDALLDLLAVSAIATGLLRLSGRLHDDQLAPERPRHRYRLIAGSLDILLGVALLLADPHSSPDVRIALGVWGLVTGTLLVLDALVLRRLARSPAGGAA